MPDEAAGAIASVVAEHYTRYISVFAEITRRAAGRFANRDWLGLQEDTVARLDGYAEAVGACVAAIHETVGDAADVREVWKGARLRYEAMVADRADAEIAATFYNSITRRLLTTLGVDADIEFLRNPETTAPPPAPAVDWYEVVVDLEATLEQALTAPKLADQWHNLRRDLRLAVVDIRRSLRLHGIAGEVDRIEMLVTPFYRGQGAYLVGRLHADGLSVPLGIAVHQTTRGLTIGAVLTEVEDTSVLFSYTRAAFFVDTVEPAGLVAYLGELLPNLSSDELYTAIGFRKHGKTELFRDFYRYITTSEERFAHARGIRGMVMIVFTAPGYDVVFKVIRDRFPWPKQTTRRQIMAKYRLVARHDRAGRLVDAHEFEHLRFDRARFAPELLDELADQATRSVTIEDDQVTLHHVYVERRLVPLDLYVREANSVKARAAVVDYGRAIKNLAAANIFPGDMLLKNFGVTKGGRVVFYDYDEITSLTDCNFREMPDSDRPDEEMAAEPWFGVGEHDVFPEEFTRFLGIRPELREVFDYQHSDLFGVRFWSRMQARLAAGEVIEIFPYKRARRLGAAIRRNPALIE